MDFMGLSTSFHSEKKVFPQCVRCFLLLNTCFTACFLSIWLCLCVLVPGLARKKLAKRLAVTLKGCTFALAFGKQGLVWPLRNGGGK